MVFKKIIALNIILTFSCGIYSFTGSSIPKEANSVYVEKIENNASLTNPIKMGAKIYGPKNYSLKNYSLNTTKALLKENLLLN